MSKDATLDSLEKAYDALVYQLKQKEIEIQTLQLPQDIAKRLRHLLEPREQLNIQLGASDNAIDNARRLSDEPDDSKLKIRISL